MKRILQYIQLLLLALHFSIYAQINIEDSLAVIEIIAANPGVYQFSVEDITFIENGRVDRLRLYSPPGTQDYERFSIVPACISKLTAMKTFSCNGQSIHMISPEIIKLDSLTKIYFNSNELTLEKEIFSIPSLKYLDVSSNNINLSNLPKEIENLTALEFLDISSNNLSGLPPEIGKLQSLKKLRNYFNQGFRIIPPEFYTLTSLIYCEFNRCYIQELPDSIGNLVNLDTLILRQNSLHSLPDSIVKLQSLTCLDLGYNYINPINLSPEVRAWADQFDPDWLSTQIGVEIAHPIPEFKSQKFALVYDHNVIHVCFQLQSPSFINLTIYDMSGRKLRTLYEGFKETGIHSIPWSCSGFSSGVYYLRLTHGCQSITEKTVLAY